MSIENLKNGLVFSFVTLIASQSMACELAELTHRLEAKKIRIVFTKIYYVVK